jgi:hypothetical protein
LLEGITDSMARNDAVTANSLYSSVKRQVGDFISLLVALSSAKNADELVDLQGARAFDAGALEVFIRQMI